MRERILITGPGGRVGSQIIPLLRTHYALRLLDSQPLKPEADDETVEADILEFDKLQAACNGVKAMVHLAAISDEADFKTKLLPGNIEGVYNAFEAARLAGVKKVIFASTGQTGLHNGPGKWVTTNMPPRPWTVYACTKMFGEALARYYSDTFGLSMIVIRICYFRAYDDPMLRIPGHPVQEQWCSPRDLTQLILKSIASPLPFGVFFGISNNKGRYWDIANSWDQLGYRPEDDASRFLPETNS